jgi:hypothetical protein
MPQITQTTRVFDGIVSLLSPSYTAGLVLSLSQSCIGTKSKQVLIIKVSVTTI